MDTAKQQEKGPLIIEGKTKYIYEVQGDPNSITAKSKSDLTKFDDPALTEHLDDKDRYATTTTSNIFNVLRQAGIPVAFKKQISDTEFLAAKCQMLMVEAVVRREKVGGYIERNPQLLAVSKQGRLRSHNLIFECFLKTDKGVITSFDGEKLGMMPEDYRKPGKLHDDPLIENPYSETWKLRHQKTPEWDERSDLNLSFPRVRFMPDHVKMEDIEEMTRRVFLLLEKQFGVFCYTLRDLKIEFGIGPNGELLVADVIDLDSLRLLDPNGKEVSKEVFRQGGSSEEIFKNYYKVSELSKYFGLPKQTIVLWRASKTDPFPKDEDLSKLIPSGIPIEKVTISAHKESAKGLRKLEELHAKYPQGAVIIALVGRSNGLGPTIAAHTAWPVISVPLTFKVFPEDVWSSLRCPSQTPSGTMLTEDLAILGALDILSISNPVAYAARQLAIEKLDNY